MLELRRKSIFIHNSLCITNPLSNEVKFYTIIKLQWCGQYNDSLLLIHNWKSSKVFLVHKTFYALWALTTAVTFKLTYIFPFQIISAKQTVCPCQFYDWRAVSSAHTYAPLYINENLWTENNWLILFVFWPALCLVFNEFYNHLTKNSHIIRNAACML